MVLNLCNTKDAVNVINKTVVVGESINVVLRNDFDPIDPIFLLTFDDANSALDFNYFELSELGRYYYLVSSEMISDRMIKIRCTLDVLETFKSEILGSEFSFNRSIRPGDYQNGSLPETTFKTVSKQDSNVTFNNGITQVLVTVGGYDNGNN